MRPLPSLARRLAPLRQWSLVGAWSARVRLRLAPVVLARSVHVVRGVVLLRAGWARWLGVMLGTSLSRWLVSVLLGRGRSVGAVASPAWARWSALVRLRLVVQQVLRSVLVGVLGTGSFEGWVVLQDAVVPRVDGPGVSR